MQHVRCPYKRIFFYILENLIIIFTVPYDVIIIRALKDHVFCFSYFIYFFCYLIFEPAHNRRNGRFPRRGGVPPPAFFRISYAKQYMNMIRHNHIAINRSVGIFFRYFIYPFFGDFSTVQQFKLRRRGDRSIREGRPLPYDFLKNILSVFGTDRQKISSGIAIIIPFQPRAFSYRLFIFHLTNEL